MSLELDERQHAMLAAMGIDLPYLRPAATTTAPKEAAASPPACTQARVATL